MNQAEIKRKIRVQKIILYHLIKKCRIDCKIVPRLKPTYDVDIRSTLRAIRHFQRLANLLSK